MAYGGMTTRRSSDTKKGSSIVIFKHSGLGVFQISAHVATQENPWNSD